jgi:hypothetical protein
MVVLPLHGGSIGPAVTSSSAEMGSQAQSTTVSRVMTSIKPVGERHMKPEDVVLAGM